MAIAQFGDALFVDLETDDRKMAAEMNGKRQPDVSKTNRRNLDLFDGKHCHGLTAGSLETAGALAIR